MVKKIIDVPDKATTIAVLENNEAVFGALNISVSGLPDAPEKRVFELPAYVLTELKTIKEDNGNDNLQGFMNDVNDDDEIWQSVEQFNSSGMPTDALLGEWLLGHIEFVKKPDQKFIVAVDSPTEFGRVEKEENGNVTVSYYHFNVKTQMFTELEADELVAGLTALNARKVKVDE